jgi:hypothetical protein
MNLYIGKFIGCKLRLTTHSRPSTILAKEVFGNKPLRVIEIGCAAGNNEGVTRAFLEHFDKSDVSILKIQEPDWMFYCNQQ